MAQQLTQQSILIVDDEAPIRKLLSSKPQSQWVRRPVRGGRYAGVEAHREAPIRPAAA